MRPAGRGPLGFGLISRQVLSRRGIRVAQDSPPGQFSDPTILGHKVGPIGGPIASVLAGGLFWPTVTVLAGGQ